MNGSPFGGNFSGNNLNLGTVFNPSLLGTGNYNVTYIYTDNNGCTDSTSTELRIEECTGISKIQSSGLSIVVYPNPAKDKLVIKNESLSSYAYFIMSDASGRVILKDELNSNEQTIDLSQFANGMYLLQIKDGEQTLKSVKVIKE